MSEENNLEIFFNNILNMVKLASGEALTMVTVLTAWTMTKQTRK